VRGLLNLHQVPACYSLLLDRAATEAVIVRRIPSHPEHEIPMDESSQIFDPVQQERALVRERLRTGALPRGPAQELFGGNGTGVVCDGCDRVISADQIEFEIHAGSVVMMHSHCMRIWYDEWAANVS
jgi:hypothetical protein